MSNLQDLLDSPAAESLDKLIEMSKECGRVQRETLLEIVETNKETEFGRKHKFSNIKSVEDYRRNVPVSEYADYEADIERLKEGEANILFPGAAQRFIVTSGTTGQAKFIPQSELGVLFNNHVTSIRKVFINDSRGLKPGEYSPSMIVVNSSNLMATKGNIQASTASGAGRKNRPPSKDHFPPQALLQASLEDSMKPDEIDYITMLFGAHHPEIRMFASNNSGYILKLMSVLNDRFDLIVKDVREGTLSADVSEELKNEMLKSLNPNPKRADELERLRTDKGTLAAKDLWPNLDSVVGWLSASMGRSLKESRNQFPLKTVFFEAGYGASEGKFNVPIHVNSPEGLPAIHGVFFEFLPLNGSEPILLEETTDGEMYELIITTYSGLYRYNIHDLIRIMVNEDGLKEIKFLGKTKDSALFNGSRVFGAELLELLQDYERENDLFIPHIQSSVGEQGLILEVEPPIEGEFNAEDFRLFMNKRLKPQNIPISEVKILPMGYRESLKDSGGIARIQRKPMVFNHEAT